MDILHNALISDLYHFYTDSGSFISSDAIQYEKMIERLSRVLFMKITINKHCSYMLRTKNNVPTISSCTSLLRTHYLLF